MVDTRNWEEVCGLYLQVDVIHQGQEKGVEVSQEECKDAPQLPLQSNAWVVILQGGNGFKQRRTKHPKQRHHNFYLGSQESWASLSSMSLACPPSMCSQGHSSPSPGCLPPPLPPEMPHLGSPQLAVWPWHRNQHALGLLVTMIVTSSIDKNSKPSLRRKWINTWDSALCLVTVVNH